MKKNTERCIVAFLGVLLFSSTVIDCANVTTVYKFNTVRSGKECVQYLNTCSVVVHLEDNHLGLPLFNTKDGNPLYVTIPPLFNSVNTSLWQMEIHASLLPLASFNQMKSYLETFHNEFWTAGKVLQEWESKIEGPLFGKQESYGLSGESRVLKVTFNTHDDSFFAGRVIYTFQQYDPENSKEMTVAFQFQKEIRVCRYPFDGGCYKGEYKVLDEVSFYIGILNSSVMIINANDFSMHNTGINIPLDYGELRYIQHWYYGYGSHASVNYKLIQTDHPNHTYSLMSPWLEIKWDTSLFILIYSYSEYDENELKDTLNVSIEEEFSNKSMKLSEFQLLEQANLNMKTLRQDGISPAYKSFLQKVIIRNPQDWTGQKRIRITTKVPILIGNVWERRDEVQIKISNRQNCMESSFTDIYSVPFAQNSSSDEPLFCYNGGQLNTSRCICPPGFIDNQCETACDRNRFGHNCSLVCSKSSSGCKGMVLCTELYGCSCAPGYHGEKCLEQCEQGLYGADCKQTCSGCESGCDIYTGNCHGKCKLPYLIGPRCDQFYSYTRQGPVFVNSNYTSVKLNINLTQNNILRPHFSNNSFATFFTIQYREDTNTTWHNGSYAKYNSSIKSVSIDGLKPGSIYHFNVLIVETVNTNDLKQISGASKGYTRCVASGQGTNLEASRISNTSINLTWKPTEDQENECPFLSYKLLVEEVNGLDTLDIDDIKKTSYEIENLTPAQSYNIVLKKSTVYGDSNPIASLNVTTLATSDDNDGDVILII